MIYKLFTRRRGGEGRAAAERAERRRMCERRHWVNVHSRVQYSVCSACGVITVQSVLPAHDRPCSDSTSVQCVCRDDVTRCCVKCAAQCCHPPGERLRFCVYITSCEGTAFSIMFKLRTLKTCLIFKILSGTSLTMDLL